MLDLNRVLKKMSQSKRNGGIFHSESDFQFQLAWNIKEMYPDVDVALEYCFNDGRIDIVISFLMEKKYL